MRTFIIVVGLVACVIIVASWTYNLSEITVGFESICFRTDEPYWSGNTPEAAAEKRAAINQTYGLWTILILVGTAAIAYMAGPANKTKEETAKASNSGAKEKSTEEDQAESGGSEKEITELKAKLKELEGLDEKEQDRHVPPEKEIIECPYCLEDIYAGAIKCKHCKTDLTE